MSDKPGGFSTSDLGHLHQVLPLVARLFEVQVSRRISRILLDTYLGSHTGHKVLEGLIKRGDGENIHSVIWFCDLRNSTGLAESLALETYLEFLNQFPDCMAGAILEHNGEVLKFIGDAVLGRFPIEDPTDPHPAAVENALDAVRDASDRIVDVNRNQTDPKIPPIEFGIALHRGDVTYGNIGTSRRLDFTVIGSATNEAARIEGLCKTLGNSILISGAFASSFAGDLVSLGHHKLRGVGEDQELFTIPD